MKIGFIGLGNMGAPMAANLAKAGHQVRGYDPTAPCPSGVQQATSAPDAARQAEVLVTMLPDGAILRNVAGEAIRAMPTGTVFCDCSTVDVDSAREVADIGRHAGIGVLDAPVSGGIGGAAAGTLTFMVGGDAAVFDRVKPLFDVMGTKTVLCGSAGAGQAAKICNNMILGATMAVTCGAFALADKLGLDRARMYDVVSTSSGQSWSMTTYCPAPGVGPSSPADNDYRPGFAAELMLKDLRLSQQAAQCVGATTRLGACAADMYETFISEGGGRGRDFSALLAWLCEDTLRN